MIAATVEDCALLEITNTTVEMLARYLAGRLHAELEGAGATNLTAIELEVEENFGQTAVYREVLHYREEDDRIAARALRAREIPDPLPVEAT